MTNMISIIGWQSLEERRVTARLTLISRADMCFNCSLSVKSMKFGMMIVFKTLKKNKGYGAIAQKSVKCEKQEF